ncbi:MAG: ATP-dependent DNA helicase [Rhodospirillaceae bacterium]|nr:ATP-dependent DNA helicase [Rhodospirillaceae bacterium]
MNHSPSTPPSPPPGPRRVMLPPAYIVVAEWSEAAVLDPDGEVKVLEPKVAAQVVAKQDLLVCHARATAARLHLERFKAADALELFAFVRPATFAVPTVDGLANALNLPRAGNIEDRPALLAHICITLLNELTALPELEAKTLRALASSMLRARWPWGPSVMMALGGSADDTGSYGAGAGLRVWTRLPEWQERAPPAPPGNQPVGLEETRARLEDLLGPDAERRAPQVEFSAAVTDAFQPRDDAETPAVVLAEAGTGVGKTLGYIAPASVWAEKNEGTVWISTFTRNLQRQLNDELTRLVPDPDEKKRRVVIRKGRENYLCLLNLEEAVNRLNTQPADAIVLGLMARWALATENGDMIGGDLPGWLIEIFGREKTLPLADRRGECIYAACAHYQKCFVERTVRRARYADIVVANHALVMVQAAMGGLDDATRPTRYVFDEGHHIFEAADSAFSAHLSGLEGADLRRWLLGAEDRGSGRARGLKKRAEDLIAAGTSSPDALIAALEETLNAVRALPGPGWRNRIRDGEPHGAAETFLQLVRQQVQARADAASPYSLETETTAPVDGLLEAADALDEKLRRLESPLKHLIAGFKAKLDADAATLDTATRIRIESLIRTLERRGLMQVIAWRDMLKALRTAPPPEFIDWMSVDRADGHDIDVGLHRHWLDPTLPFARAIADQAHGIAVTSATLLDGSGDLEVDWAAAERRMGAAHLGADILRSAQASPFNYAQNTLVLVITDVRKDDTDTVAAAFRELFLAAGGGALGLFTSIARLRGVHKRIASPLEHSGLPLYAQHVDDMDTGTLVDIFRAEENACLLGTDALREGVDVPGRSLRLVVCDRVPWPRPDIVHKARRAFFGKRYDDAVTRLRLKQAFGRLIRRATDRGVFVMLDSSLPSRLRGAFPVDARYERVGLAEAIGLIKQFLTAAAPPPL